MELCFWYLSDKLKLFYSCKTRHLPSSPAPPSVFYKYNTQKHLLILHQTSSIAAHIFCVVLGRLFFIVIRHPSEPTCISCSGWMWSEESNSRLQTHDRAGFCTLATEKFSPKWTSTTLTPLIPNTLLAAKKPYNVSAGTLSCQWNIKRYEWVKHILWKYSVMQQLASYLWTKNVHETWQHTMTS